MRMYVSIPSWGSNRSVAEKKSGIYILDFENRRVTPIYEITVCSQHRGFAGLTFDRDRIYTSCFAQNTSDTIVVIDRKTHVVEHVLQFAGMYDVHQIDCYGDHIWLCNTNCYEVVALSRDTCAVASRWKIFEGLREERELTSRDKVRFGDPRKRVHMNSVRLSTSGCQIGHFGADEGSFDSPQLSYLSWDKANNLQSKIHHNVDVSGMRFPHNVYQDDAGRLFGCISGEGRVILRGEMLHVGGWVRGIAHTDRLAFVGVSSASYYGEENGNAKPMEVVKIDLNTLEVLDRFEFPRPGQIYDIRLVSEPDYGMSSPIY
jgi:hypothetical protein